MSYHIHSGGQAVSIELADAEMSSGGQGRIYRILSPGWLRGHCAKIYKNSANARACKEKITYMVRHRPANASMENIRICWPEYAISDSVGTFCGYAMPLAFEKSRDLKIIEIYSFGKTIAEKYPAFPQWHGKYELDTAGGFTNRIKMLHNWALATEIIHREGKYVIVDLKPDNVLATADGKISVVDTDSFQIADKGVTFPGPVATPEYFARFARERHARGELQTTDCDCFAMAVAFYKTLVGSHPYSGYKRLPPYDGDEYADIASHINADLFVFGKNRRYIELLAKGNMHERFQRLPEVLRGLFMRAFTAQRQPSAAQWRKALSDVLAPGGTRRAPGTGATGIASADSSETRCLCVLAVDVSGSMKLCEEVLNRSLRTLFSDLLRGTGGFRECSREQVEIGVIQFDSEVTVVRPPGLVRQGESVPSLRVRGLTTDTVAALRRAIDMVERRKAHYKTRGLSYYRPWIILLTDGNPNPFSRVAWRALVREIRCGVSARRFTLTAIGIGTSVNRELLADVSVGSCVRIAPSHIASLFTQLSTSLGLGDGAAESALLDTLKDEI